MVILAALVELHPLVKFLIACTAWLTIVYGATFAIDRIWGLK